MAINPDDFIFHSDYTVYGLIDTYQEDIVIPTTPLAANTATVFYGEQHNIGSARSTSVATYIVPNLPQYNGVPATGSSAPGVIRKGNSIVSTTQATGQQPIGIWFFPFVYQDGLGNIKAAVQCYNNDTTTKNIPASTWKIKISTYLIPPSTT